MKTIVTTLVVSAVLIIGCTQARRAAEATTQAAADPFIQQAVDPIPFGRTALAVLGAIASTGLAIDQAIRRRRAATDAAAKTQALQEIVPAVDELLDKVGEAAGTWKSKQKQTTSQQTQEIVAQIKSAAA